MIIDSHNAINLDEADLLVMKEKVEAGDLDEELFQEVMASVEEEKIEDITEVDEEVVTEEVMPSVEEEKIEDITEVDEEVVTEESIKQFVAEGKNTAVIVYDQPSSGKTYTMHGGKHDDNIFQPGIIHIIANDVFSYVEDIKER